MPSALAIERTTPNGLRTLDRKFILLHSLSTVALLADLETTARAVAAQPSATELNPLFGNTQHGLDSMASPCR